MNLAIIIGISKYEKLHDLPSCQNDAHYFHKLLDLSQKYDNILYLDQNTDSNTIMDSIDEFVNEYSTSEINEILLYFSGHGYYNEDEFYFCTSNIDVSKINSTSITNTDIDRIIKKLSPETYVKIIDACESGHSYIKDLGNREKIFQKNSRVFKNCYFFSSSESTQYSYASERISDFTKSFLEIIKDLIIKNKIDNIKYRQVSSALSDEYALNSKQTPFFVSQGTLAELFLSRNARLEQFLKDLNFDKVTEENADDLSENNVEEVNKLIPSKEEAQTVKEEFIKQVCKYLKEKVQHLLKEYKYNQNIINISSDEVFNNYKIGKWLSENKDKYLVFASEKYTRKYSKNALFNITAMLNNDNVEYELSSFKLNVDENESIYQIELVSENQLPKYCCQLVIIYSLTKIYLFYDFTYSHPKNWDEYSSYNASEKVNIATLNIKEKDSLNSNIEKVCNEFQDYCSEHLKRYLEVLFEK